MSEQEQPKTNNRCEISDFKKRSLLICCLCSFALLIYGMTHPSLGESQSVLKAGQNAAPPAVPFVDVNATVPVLKPQIEVGPIDIHKKYRSMEGPYVIRKFRVSDLLASKKIELPGNSIIYLDSGKTAPAMNDAKSDADSSCKLKGLVDTAGSEPELYWFRGIKLQVLDENNKALPTAEFICHMNLDVDKVTRYMEFPELERTGNERLVTLTQGQTEFHFPAPYAVPVSGDEEWKFTFQAANRTTNKHRVIKHLCTLYFSKDKELKEPLRALHWLNPYVAVQLDNADKAPEHHGPSCMALTPGANAPNMVPDTDFKDPLGRKMTGHWVIPPGKHYYQTPITESIDPDFAKEDRKIHAVWSHVHPACTGTVLSKCEGDKRENIFAVNVKTKFQPGAELVHIDNVISREGIALPSSKNYELSTTYDNPLGEPLDSMVALGIFCESKTFVKPEWCRFDGKVVSHTAGKTPKGKTPRGTLLHKIVRSQAVAKKSAKCNDLYCGIRNKN